MVTTSTFTPSADRTSNASTAPRSEEELRVLTRDIVTVERREFPPELRAPQIERSRPDLVFEAKDFQLTTGRVLESARLGCCVYASENGRVLDVSRDEDRAVAFAPDRKIVVVHPALTGSAIAVAREGGASNQGEGWGQHWIGPEASKLNPEMYTVVVVEHFGGSGYESSTAADELESCLTEIRASDTVRLASTMLEQQGVSEIFALLGGSFGADHVEGWIKPGAGTLPVRNAVHICGSPGRDEVAKEFFRIQRDLLSPDPDFNDLATRLVNNLRELTETQKAESGFRTACDLVVSELRELSADATDAERLACARKVGFLRFVAPGFYEQKFDDYLRRSGDDHAVATARLEDWFDRHGREFINRFSAAGLRCLSNMYVEAHALNPDELAHRLLESGTKLTAVRVNGDSLFPAEPNRRFFEQVQDALEVDASPGGGAIQILRQIEIVDSIKGHDLFLDPAFAEVLGTIVGQLK